MASALRPYIEVTDRVLNVLASQSKVPFPVRERNEIIGLVEAMKHDCNIELSKEHYDVIGTTSIHRGAVVQVRMSLLGTVRGVEWRLVSDVPCARTQRNFLIEAHARASSYAAKQLASYERQLFISFLHFLGPLISRAGDHPTYSPSPPETPFIRAPPPDSSPDEEAWRIRTHYPTLTRGSFLDGGAYVTPIKRELLYLLSLTPSLNTSATSKSASLTLSPTGETAREALHDQRGAIAGEAARRREAAGGGALHAGGPSSSSSQPTDSGRVTPLSMLASTDPYFGWRATGQFELQPEVQWTQYGGVGDVGGGDDAMGSHDVDREDGMRLALQREIAIRAGGAAKAGGAGMGSGKAADGSDGTLGRPKARVLASSVVQLAILMGEMLTKLDASRWEAIVAQQERERKAHEEAASQEMAGGPTSAPPPKENASSSTAAATTTADATTLLRECSTFSDVVGVVERLYGWSSDVEDKLVSTAVSVIRASYVADSDGGAGAVNVSRLEAERAVQSALVAADDVYQDNLFKKFLNGSEGDRLAFAQCVREAVGEGYVRSMLLDVRTAQLKEWAKAESQERTREWGGDAANEDAAFESLLAKASTSADPRAVQEAKRALLRSLKGAPSSSARGFPWTYSGLSAAARAGGKSNSTDWREPALARLVYHMVQLYNADEVADRNSTNVEAFRGAVTASASGFTGRRLSVALEHVTAKARALLVLLCHAFEVIAPEKERQAEHARMGEWKQIITSAAHDTERALWPKLFDFERLWSSDRAHSVGAEWARRTPPGQETRRRWVDRARGVVSSTAIPAPSADIQKALAEHAVPPSQQLDVVLGRMRQLWMDRMTQYTGCVWSFGQGRDAHVASHTGATHSPSVGTKEGKCTTVNPPVVDGSRLSIHEFPVWEAATARAPCLTPEAIESRVNAAVDALVPPAAQSVEHQAQWEQSRQLVQQSAEPLKHLLFHLSYCVKEAPVPHRKTGKLTVKTPSWDVEFSAGRMSYLTSLRPTKGDSASTSASKVVRVGELRRRLRDMAGRIVPRSMRQMHESNGNPALRLATSPPQQDLRGVRAMDFDEVKTDTIAAELRLSPMGARGEADRTAVDLGLTSPSATQAGGRAIASFNDDPAANDRSAELALQAVVGVRKDPTPSIPTTQATRSWAAEAERRKALGRNLTPAHLARMMTLESEVENFVPGAPHTLTARRGADGTRSAEQHPYLRPLQPSDFPVSGLHYAWAGGVRQHPRLVALL